MSVYIQAADLQVRLVPPELMRRSEKERERHAHICKYVHFTSICTTVCVYSYIYVYIYIHMYACNIYIYMYIYRYGYNLNSGESLRALTLVASSRL